MFWQVFSGFSRLCLRLVRKRMSAGVLTRTLADLVPHAAVQLKRASRTRRRMIVSVACEFLLLTVIYVTAYHRSLTVALDKQLELKTTERHRCQTSAHALVRSLGRSDHPVIYRRTQLLHCCRSSCVARPCTAPCIKVVVHWWSALEPRAPVSQPVRHRS